MSNKFLRLWRLNDNIREMRHYNSVEGGSCMLHVRLEKLRERKGLSKAELCRQLNLPQTTYSGYALGTREPDIETINRFAKFYGVSVDYLISGNEGGEFKKRIDSIIDDFVSLSEEDQEQIQILIKRMKKSSN